jgi:predicted DNA-binding transcriptional regulator YafY
VRRETPDFETATEFHTNFTNIEVEMEVDATIRSEVEEWIGIDNVHLRYDGKIIATALLPDDQTLPASIMRFGTHVKVLSPSSLVKTLKNLAESIINKYEK